MSEPATSQKVRQLHNLGWLERYQSWITALKGRHKTQGRHGRDAARKGLTGGECPHDGIYKTALGALSYCVKDLLWHAPPWENAVGDYRILRRLSY